MATLICNPVAGNGLGKKVGEMIAERMRAAGNEPTFLLTERPGHATELARAAAEKGETLVFSVGGDGTAYEVALGLAGTNAALCVIPAGTGNDFIKSAGIPKDPEKALECALASPALPTDIARLNDRMYLNVAGAGFDVCVLEYAAKAKKYVKGLLPYLYGVIRTIFSFKPVELTYSLDGGEEITKKMLIAAAGNGAVIGGGIPIAPDAKIDDGLLSVTLIEQVPSRLRMLSYLPKLLGGRVYEFPETTKHVCKKFSFSAKGMKVNVDGEIIPMDRAEIEILPGALLVRRPKRETECA